MNSVFISYSRKNSDFVKRLYEALSQKGRDVWVDWEDIPPRAEWEKEIHHGINKADAVIFVLSPDFLASEVCKEELQLAITQYKRLTPIVCENISYQQVTPDLARLNWIFFRPEDDFSGALDKLAKALDTNLDHVQNHTRLLVRAEEWRKKDFNHSYLLRGSDLTEAETWLRETANEEPRPAPLHTDYILRSRSASERRKRNFFMRIMVGVLLVSVAAIVAYFQYQEKQKQRQIADARSLINQSNNLRSDAGKYIPTHEQLTRSLKLSVDALDDYQQLGMQSVSADQSVRDSLSALATVEKYDSARQFELGKTQDIALSVGRDFLAFAHDLPNANPISIWDVQARTMRAKWSAQADLKQLAISADGQYIASLSYDKTQKYASVVTLWQLTPSEDAQQQYPYQAQALFSIKRSGQSQTLSFSADGHYLLLQNAKGYWEGWRIKGTQRIRLSWLKRVQQKGKKLRQLQVSPDSQRIAGVQHYGRDGNRYIVQYDIKKGTELSAWALANRFDTLRWTADSGSLLLETAGYFLHVNAKTGRLSAVHHSPVLNADLNQVATLAENTVGGRTLYSIDVTRIGSQRKLFRFPHSVEPRFFSFLPDNTGLVVLQDHELYYWAFEDTAAHHVFSHEEDLKQAPQLLAGFGKLPLNSPTQSSHIDEKEAQKLEALPARLGLEAYMHLVGFSPDNLFLLTAEREGFVLRHKDTLASIRRFSHTDPKAFAFSPDGRLLATSAADWHLRIWQVDNGEEIARIPRRQKTKSLHISADQQWLLVKEDAGSLRLWALSAEDLLAQACQRLDNTEFACETK